MSVEYSDRNIPSGPVGGATFVNFECPDLFYSLKMPNKEQEDEECDLACQSFGGGQGTTKLIVVIEPPK